MAPSAITAARQQIAQVGQDAQLAPTGLSDVDLALEAIAEAIELPDRRFALGVQWHPEADLETRVIEAVVVAAREKPSPRLPKIVQARPG